MQLHNHFKMMLLLTSIGTSTSKVLCSTYEYQYNHVHVLWKIVYTSTRTSKMSRTVKWEVWIVFLVDTCTRLWYDCVICSLQTWLSDRLKTPTACRKWRASHMCRVGWCRSGTSSRSSCSRSNGWWCTRVFSQLNGFSCRAKPEHLRSMLGLGSIALEYR